MRRARAARRLALAAAGTMLLASTVAAIPARAVTLSPIQGSGSSWAADQINQSIADLQPTGLEAVYTPSGSAQGRQDFANATTDFAVTDVPYLGTDPRSGSQDSSARPYAYVPITAGAIAFPYQLQLNGVLKTNLRLSGLTIAKIFTGQITNWGDSEITADNNGQQLPNVPIIPVIHAEGSGASYALSQYLASQYPSVWRSAPSPYFPDTGSDIAENGSDGVVNYVQSGAANGAIGFDEYQYALGTSYPVANIENAAGYYVPPSPYNVSIALTQSTFDQDEPSIADLTADLDNVFAATDPRAYPVSTYSYMVIPTSAQDPLMSTAKRQTLADFVFHGLCQAQKEAAPIGYAPLPLNLVRAGLSVMADLQAADPGVDLSADQLAECNNPTFVPSDPDSDYFSQLAPQPASCDLADEGPCLDGDDTASSGGSSSTPPPPTSSAPGGARSSSAPPIRSTAATSSPTVRLSPSEATTSTTAVHAQLALATTGNPSGRDLAVALLMLAGGVGASVIGRRRRVGRHAIY